MTIENPNINNDNRINQNNFDDDIEINAGAQAAFEIVSDTIQNEDEIASEGVNDASQLTSSDSGTSTSHQTEAVSYIREDSEGNYVLNLREPDEKGNTTDLSDKAVIKGEVDDDELSPEVKGYLYDIDTEANYKAEGSPDKVIYPFSDDIGALKEEFFQGVNTSNLSDADAFTTITDGINSKFATMEPSEDGSFRPMSEIIESKTASNDEKTVLAASMMQRYLIDEAGNTLKGSSESVSCVGGIKDGVNQFVTSVSTDSASMIMNFENSEVFEGKATEYFDEVNFEMKAGEVTVLDESEPVNNFAADIHEMNVEKVETGSEMLKEASGSPEIEELITQIFPEGTEGLSDQEKAERINEYINDNLEYKSEVVDNWTSPDELAAKISNGEKPAVDCEEYAMLKAALLNNVGIKSDVVITENGSHAQGLATLSDGSTYVMEMNSSDSGLIDVSLEEYYDLNDVVASFNAEDFFLKETTDLINTMDDNTNRYGEPSDRDGDIDKTIIDGSSDAYFRNQLGDEMFHPIDPNSADAAYIYDGVSAADTSGAESVYDCMGEYDDLLKDTLGSYNEDDFFYYETQTHKTGKSSYSTVLVKKADADAWQAFLTKLNKIKLIMELQAIAAKMLQDLEKMFLKALVNAYYASDEEDNTAVNTAKEYAKDATDFVKLSKKALDKFFDECDEFNNEQMQKLLDQVDANTDTSCWNTFTSGLVGESPEADALDMKADIMDAFATLNEDAADDIMDTMLSFYEGKHDNEFDADPDSPSDQIWQNLTGLENEQNQLMEDFANDDFFTMTGNGYMDIDTEKFTMYQGKLNDLQQREKLMLMALEYIYEMENMASNTITDTNLPSKDMGGVSKAKSAEHSMRSSLMGKAQMKTSMAKELHNTANKLRLAAEKMRSSAFLNSFSMILSTVAVAVAFIPAVGQIAAAVVAVVAAACSYAGAVIANGIDDTYDVETMHDNASALSEEIAMMALKETHGAMSEDDEEGYGSAMNTVGNAMAAAESDMYGELQNVNTGLVEQKGDRFVVNNAKLIEIEERMKKMQTIMRLCMEGLKTLHNMKQMAANALTDKYGFSSTGFGQLSGVVELRIQKVNTIKQALVSDLKEVAERETSIYQRKKAMRDATIRFGVSIVCAAISAIPGAAVVGAVLNVAAQIVMTEMQYGNTARMDVGNSLDFNTDQAQVEGASKNKNTFGDALADIEAEENALLQDCYNNGVQGTNSGSDSALFGASATYGADYSKIANAAMKLEKLQTARTLTFQAWQMMKSFQNALTTAMGFQGAYSVNATSVASGLNQSTQTTFGYMVDQLNQDAQLMTDKAAAQKQLNLGYFTAGVSAVCIAGGAAISGATGALIGNMIGNVLGSVFRYIAAESDAQEDFGTLNDEFVEQLDEVKKKDSAENEKIINENKEMSEFANAVSAAESNLQAQEADLLRQINPSLISTGTGGRMVISGEKLQTVLFQMNMISMMRETLVDTMNKIMKQRQRVAQVLTGVKGEGMDFSGVAQSKGQVMKQVAQFAQQRLNQIVARNNQIQNYKLQATQALISMIVTIGSAIASAVGGAAGEGSKDSSDSSAGSQSTDKATSTADLVKYSNILMDVMSNLAPIIAEMMLGGGKFDYTPMNQNEVDSLLSQYISKSSSGKGEGKGQVGGEQSSRFAIYTKFMTAIVESDHAIMSSKVTQEQLKAQNRIRQIKRDIEMKMQKAIFDTLTDTSMWTKVGQAVKSDAAGKLDFDKANALEGKPADLSKDELSKLTPSQKADRSAKEATYNNKLNKVDAIFRDNHGQVDGVHYVDKKSFDAAVTASGMFSADEQNNLSKLVGKYNAERGIQFNNQGQPLVVPIDTKVASVESLKETTVPDVAEDKGSNKLTQTNAQGANNNTKLENKAFKDMNFFEMVAKGAQLNAQNQLKGMTQKAKFNRVFDALLDTTVKESETFYQELVVKAINRLLSSAGEQAKFNPIRKSAAQVNDARMLGMTLASKDGKISDNDSSLFRSLFGEDAPRAISHAIIKTLLGKETADKYAPEKETDMTQITEGVMHEVSRVGTDTFSRIFLSKDIQDKLDNKQDLDKNDKNEIRKIQDKENNLRAELFNAGMISGGRYTAKLSATLENLIKADAVTVKYEGDSPIVSVVSGKEAVVANALGISSSDTKTVNDVLTAIQGDVNPAKTAKEALVKIAATVAHYNPESGEQLNLSVLNNLTSNEVARLMDALSMPASDKPTNMMTHVPGLEDNSAAIAFGKIFGGAGGMSFNARERALAQNVLALLTDSQFDESIQQSAWVAVADVNLDKSNMDTMSLFNFIGELSSNLNSIDASTNSTLHSVASKALESLQEKCLSQAFLEVSSSADKQAIIANVLMSGNENMIEGALSKSSMDKANITDQDVQSALKLAQSSLTTSNAAFFAHSLQLLSKTNPDLLERLSVQIGEAPQNAEDAKLQQYINRTMDNSIAKVNQSDLQQKSDVDNSKALLNLADTINALKSKASEGKYAQATKDADVAFKEVQTIRDQQEQATQQGSVVEANAHNSARNLTAQIRKHVIDKLELSQNATTEEINNAVAKMTPAQAAEMITSINNNVLKAETPAQQLVEMVQKKQVEIKNAIISAQKDGKISQEKANQLTQSMEKITADNFDANTSMANIAAVSTVVSSFIQANTSQDLLRAAETINNSQNLAEALTSVADNNIIANLKSANLTTQSAVVSNGLEAIKESVLSPISSAITDSNKMETIITQLNTMVDGAKTLIANPTNVSTSNDPKVKTADKNITDFNPADVLSSNADISEATEKLTTIITELSAKAQTADPAEKVKLEAQIEQLKTFQTKLTETTKNLANVASDNILQSSDKVVNLVNSMTVDNVADNLKNLDSAIAERIVSAEINKENPAVKMLTAVVKSSGEINSQEVSTIAAGSQEKINELLSTIVQLSSMDKIEVANGVQVSAKDLAKQLSKELMTQILTSSTDAAKNNIKFMNAMASLVKNNPTLGLDTLSIVSQDFSAKMPSTNLFASLLATPSDANANYQKAIDKFIDAVLLSPNQDVGSKDNVMRITDMLDTMLYEIVDKVSVQSTVSLTQEQIKENQMASIMGQDAPHDTYQSASVISMDIVDYMISHDRLDSDLLANMLMKVNSTEAATTVASLMNLSEDNQAATNLFSETMEKLVGTKDSSAVQSKKASEMLKKANEILSERIFSETARLDQLRVQHGIAGATYRDAQTAINRLEKAKAKIEQMVDRASQNAAKLEQVTTQVSQGLSIADAVKNNASRLLDIMHVALSGTEANRKEAMDALATMSKTNPKEAAKIMQDLYHTEPASLILGFKSVNQSQYNEISNVLNTMITNERPADNQKPIFFDSMVEIANLLNNAAGGNIVKTDPVTVIPNAATSNVHNIDSNESVSYNVMNTDNANRLASDTFSGAQNLVDMTFVNSVASSNNNVSALRTDSSVDNLTKVINDPSLSDNDKAAVIKDLVSANKIDAKTLSTVVSSVKESTPEKEKQVIQAVIAEVMSNEKSAAAFMSSYAAQVSNGDISVENAQKTLSFALEALQQAPPDTTGQLSAITELLKSMKIDKTNVDNPKVVTEKMSDKAVAQIIEKAPQLIPEMISMSSNKTKLDTQITKALNSDNFAQGKSVSEKQTILNAVISSSASQDVKDLATSMLTTLNKDASAENIQAITQLVTDDKMAISEKITQFNTQLKNDPDMIKAFLQAMSDSKGKPEHAQFTEMATQLLSDEDVSVEFIMRNPELTVSDKAQMIMNQISEKPEMMQAFLTSIANSKGSSEEAMYKTVMADILSKDQTSAVMLKSLSQFDAQGLDKSEFKDAISVMINSISDLAKHDATGKTDAVVKILKAVKDRTLNNTELTKPVSSLPENRSLAQQMAKTNPKLLAAVFNFAEGDKVELATQIRDALNDPAVQMNISSKEISDARLQLRAQIAQFVKTSQDLPVIKNVSDLHRELDNIDAKVTDGTMTQQQADLSKAQMLLRVVAKSDTETSVRNEALNIINQTGDNSLDQSAKVAAMRSVSSEILTSMVGANKADSQPIISVSISASDVVANINQTINHFNNSNVKVSSYAMVQEPVVQEPVITDVSVSNSLTELQKMIDNPMYEKKDVQESVEQFIKDNISQDGLLSKDAVTAIKKLVKEDGFYEILTNAMDNASGKEEKVYQQIFTELVGDDKTASAFFSSLMSQLTSDNAFVRTRAENVIDLGIQAMEVAPDTTSQLSAITELLKAMKSDKNLSAQELVNPINKKGETIVTNLAESFPELLASLVVSSSGNKQNLAKHISSVAQSSDFGTELDADQYTITKATLLVAAQSVSDSDLSLIKKSTQDITSVNDLHIALNAREGDISKSELLLRVIANSDLPKETRLAATDIFNGMENSDAKTFAVRNVSVETMMQSQAEAKVSDSKEYTLLETGLMDNPTTKGLITEYMNTGRVDKAMALMATISTEGPAGQQVFDAESAADILASFDTQKSLAITAEMINESPQFAEKAAEIVDALYSDISLKDSGVDKKKMAVELVKLIKEAAVKSKSKETGFEYAYRHYKLFDNVNQNLSSFTQKLSSLNPDLMKSVSISETKDEFGRDAKLGDPQQDMLDGLRRRNQIDSPVKAEQLTRIAEPESANKIFEAQSKILMSPDPKSEILKLLYSVDMSMSAKADAIKFAIERDLEVDADIVKAVFDAFDERESNIEKTLKDNVPDMVKRSIESSLEMVRSEKMMILQSIMSNDKSAQLVMSHVNQTSEDNQLLSQLFKSDSDIKFSSDQFRGVRPSVNAAKSREISQLLLDNAVISENSKGELVLASDWDNKYKAIEHKLSALNVDVDDVAAVLDKYKETPVAAITKRMLREYLVPKLQGTKLDVNTVVEKLNTALVNAQIVDKDTGEIKPEIKSYEDVIAKLKSLSGDKAFNYEDVGLTDKDVEAIYGNGQKVADIQSVITTNTFIGAGLKESETGDNAIFNKLVEANVFNENGTLYDNWYNNLQSSFSKDGLLSQCRGAIISELQKSDEVSKEMMKMFTEYNGSKTDFVAENTLAVELLMRNNPETASYMINLLNHDGISGNAREFADRMIRDAVQLRKTPNGQDNPALVSYMFRTAVRLAPTLADNNPTAIVDLINKGTMDDTESLIRLSMNSQNDLVRNAAASKLRMNIGTLENDIVSQISNIVDFEIVDKGGMTSLERTQKILDKVNAFNLAVKDAVYGYSESQFVQVNLSEGEIDAFVSQLVNSKDSDSYLNLIMQSKSVDDSSKKNLLLKAAKVNSEIATKIFDYISDRSISLIDAPKEEKENAESSEKTTTTPDVSSGTDNTEDTIKPKVAAEILESMFKDTDVVSNLMSNKANADKIVNLRNRISQAGYTENYLLYFEEMFKSLDVVSDVFRGNANSAVDGMEELYESNFGFENKTEMALQIAENIPGEHRDKMASELERQIKSEYDSNGNLTENTVIKMRMLARISPDSELLGKMLDDSVDVSVELDKAELLLDVLVNSSAKEIKEKALDQFQKMPEYIQIEALRRVAVEEVSDDARHNSEIHAVTPEKVTNKMYSILGENFTDLIEKAKTADKEYGSVSGIINDNSISPDNKADIIIDKMASMPSSAAKMAQEMLNSFYQVKSGDVTESLSDNERQILRKLVNDPIARAALTSASIIMSNADIVASDLTLVAADLIQEGVSTDASVLSAFTEVMKSIKEKSDPIKTLDDIYESAINTSTKEFVENVTKSLPVKYISADSNLMNIASQYSDLQEAEAATGLVDNLQFLVDNSAQDMTLTKRSIDALYNKVSAINISGDHLDMEDLITLISVMSVMSNKEVDNQTQIKKLTDLAKTKFNKAINGSDSKIVEKVMELICNASPDTEKRLTINVLKEPFKYPDELVKTVTSHGDSYDDAEMILDIALDSYNPVQTENISISSLHKNSVFSGNNVVNQFLENNNILDSGHHYMITDNSSPEECLTVLADPKSLSEDIGQARKVFENLSPEQKKQAVEMFAAKVMANYKLDMTDGHYDGFMFKGLTGASDMSLEQLSKSMFDGESFIEKIKLSDSEEKSFPKTDKLIELISSVQDGSVEYNETEHAVIIQEAVNEASTNSSSLLNLVNQMINSDHNNSVVNATIKQIEENSSLSITPAFNVSINKETLSSISSEKYEDLVDGLASDLFKKGLVRSDAARKMLSSFCEWFDAGAKKTFKEFADAKGIVYEPELGQLLDQAVETEQFKENMSRYHSVDVAIRRTIPEMALEGVVNKNKAIMVNGVIENALTEIAEGYPERLRSHLDEILEMGVNQSNIDLCVKTIAKVKDEGLQKKLIKHLSFKIGEEKRGLLRESINSIMPDGVAQNLLGVSKEAQSYQLSDGGALKERGIAGLSSEPANGSQQDNPILTMNSTQLVNIVTGNDAKQAASKLVLRAEYTPMTVAEILNSQAIEGNMDKMAQTAQELVALLAYKGKLEDAKDFVGNLSDEIRGKMDKQQINNRLLELLSGVGMTSMFAKVLDDMSEITCLLDNIDKGNVEQSNNDVSTEAEMVDFRKNAQAAMNFSAINKTPRARSNGYKEALQMLDIISEANYFSECLLFSDYGKFEMELVEISSRACDLHQEAEGASVKKESVERLTYGMLDLAKQIEAMRLPEAEFVSDTLVMYALSMNLAYKQPDMSAFKDSNIQPVLDRIINSSEPEVKEILVNNNLITEQTENKVDILEERILADPTGSELELSVLLKSSDITPDQKSEIIKRAIGKNLDSIEDIVDVVLSGKEIDENLMNVLAPELVSNDTVVAKFMEIVSRKVREDNSLKEQVESLISITMESIDDNLDKVKSREQALALKELFGKLKDGVLALGEVDDFIFDGVLDRLIDTNPKVVQFVKKAIKPEEQVGLEKELNESRKQSEEKVQSIIQKIMEKSTPLERQEELRTLIYDDNLTLPQIDRILDRLTDLKDEQIATALVGAARDIADNNMVLNVEQRSRATAFYNKAIEYDIEQVMDGMLEDILSELSEDALSSKELYIPNRYLVMTDLIPGILDQSQNMEPQKFTDAMLACELMVAMKNNKKLTDKRNELENTIISIKSLSSLAKGKNVDIASILSAGNSDFDKVFRKTAVSVIEQSNEDELKGIFEELPVGIFIQSIFSGQLSDEEGVIIEDMVGRSGVEFDTNTLGMNYNESKLFQRILGLDPEQMLA